MLKQSLRLYQAVAPISKDEFLQAISRVFPAALQDGPRKVGLAVSGGVDSMALAVLCHEYLPRAIALHAMIVDHGLRPTSASEALKTSNSLRQRLGMQTHILKNVRLTGNGYRKAPAIRAMETHARHMRYTCITQCCRQEGIKDMLIAHHEDDQYETIILRLTQHSFVRPGISDINTMETATKTMPEQMSSSGEHSMDALWTARRKQDIECFGTIGIPNLRITTRRPLLDFAKERLTATCESYNMPWVEDETNANSGLTPRNAIRDIVRKAKLPAALSKHHILSLWSKKQEKSNRIRDIANSLLANTCVQLDLRTGSAVVTLPSTTQLVDQLARVARNSANLPVESVPYVISLYVASLAQLASPTHDLSSNVHHDITETLFSQPIAKRKPFTYSKVLFEPLTEGKWLLSAERIRLSKRETRLRTASVQFHAGNYVSKFRELDHKWWIKLWIPSPMHRVIVRYLRPCHLNRLQARLEARQILLHDVTDPLSTPRNLDAILSSLGPHHLRWSLPVLVVRSEAFHAQLESLLTEEQMIRSLMVDDPDAETVLAFPTLNLRVKEKERNGEFWWLDHLKWEVWYKHLAHLDEQKLAESIVLPTSMESIGLVEKGSKKVQL